MTTESYEMQYKEKLVQAIEHQLGRLLPPRLQQAFLQVPRHLFVQHYYQQQGNSLNWDYIWAPTFEDLYSDQALVTQINQRGMPSSSSSQPSLTAEKLEALNLVEGQRVLEIGTGTGYNAALMGHLVGEFGHIISIDIDETLVEAAQRHLKLASITNVEAFPGDGFVGYPPSQPYHRIIATCGIRTIPQAWLSQLYEHGLLVCNLLFELASVFLRLERQDATTFRGSLLPIKGQYMEMSHPDIQQTHPNRVDWKQYDAIYSTEYTLEVNLTHLLNQPSYAMFLQCHLPTISRKYRWNAQDHQTDIYLIEQSRHVAIRVQENKLRVFGDGDDIIEQIHTSIALYERLHPLIEDYKVLVTEKEAIVTLNSWSYSLNLISQENV